MSTEVLLPGADWREGVRPEGKTVFHPAGWDPEDFGREQIRSLVRQVFLANGRRPIRQYVFSGLDAETDVKSVCMRVGVALALETAGSVAVVGGQLQVLRDTETSGPQVRNGSAPLCQSATRLRSNLWLVPAPERLLSTTGLLHGYLGDVRREFEYSIVEAPPPGELNETTTMAQFADGIILVLSAHRTRRVVARTIKQALEAAQARVLGTVLSDRVFPIPEGIYRRL
jgi:hypothetical protein